MLTTLLWLLAVLATIQFQRVFVAADNSDNTRDLCGQFDNWNSTNPAQPYLFINNAWGDDGSGSSCLNVSDDGASWTVTYKWTGVETLVKGYPHMKAFPSNLPVPLQNISHLNLKASWSTVMDGTQNDNAAEQALQLHLHAVRSNVAVDMFLSPIAANSTMENPPIEIMIWPWYSPYVKPLGWQYNDPTKHVLTVDGMNFSMYDGINDGGQHVFSWLAHQNLSSTNADYAPLLKYMWQQNLLPGDLWVGSLEFGTEVLHSADTTIFSMDDYDMRLIRQGDKDDYTSTTTSMTSTSTAMTETATSRPVVTTTSATTSAASATSSSGASGLMRSSGGDGTREGVLGVVMFLLTTYML